MQQITTITSVKNVRIELLTASKKRRSVIAQAFGTGTVQLLAELGVQIVASEPDERSSVGDFVDAALKTESEEVILIPADLDTLKVVEIAVGLLKEMGIAASIVAATSIPALLAAVSVFEDNSDLITCVEKMNAASKVVKSYGIAIADRNSFAEAKIFKDEFLLVQNNTVVSHSTKFSELIPVLKSDFETRDLITLIWGRDISSENKNHLKSQLNEIEFVEIDGLQDVWQVLVGIE